MFMLTRADAGKKVYQRNSLSFETLDVILADKDNCILSHTCYVSFVSSET